jgi:hypothetical protein
VALADDVLVLSHGEARHHGPASSFSPETAAELYRLGGPRADGDAARPQPGH